MNDADTPTRFIKKNTLYKNIRNFHNLYDDRSQASVNLAMQDSLRLGNKRPWLIKKGDHLNFTSQYTPKQANLKISSPDALNKTSLQGDMSSQAAQMLS